MNQVDNCKETEQSHNEPSNILAPSRQELQIKRSLRWKANTHEVVEPECSFNRKQSGLTGQPTEAGSCALGITDANRRINVTSDAGEDTMPGDTVMVDVNASEDEFYSDTDDDDKSLSSCDGHGESSTDDEASEDELNGENLSPLQQDIPVYHVGQQESTAVNNTDSVVVSKKTQIAMDPEVQLVVKELVQEGIKEGIREYKQLEANKKKASKSLRNVNKLIRTPQ